MENRRIRMTRKLIRGALIELLQEKTIDKISVKEICARADVNRSTFYDHYEDIYALLGDMEAEFISQIPQEYASASIRAQLLGFVRYVRDHQQLYAAIRKYSDMVRKRLIPLILQNYISEMQPEGSEAARDGALRRLCGQRQRLSARRLDSPGLRPEPRRHDRSADALRLRRVQQPELNGFCGRARETRSSARRAIQKQGAPCGKLFPRMARQLCAIARSDRSRALSNRPSRRADYPRRRYAISSGSLPSAPQAQTSSMRPSPTTP